MVDHEFWWFSAYFSLLLTLFFLRRVKISEQSKCPKTLFQNPPGADINFLPGELLFFPLADSEIMSPGESMLLIGEGDSFKAASTLATAELEGYPGGSPWENTCGTQRKSSNSTDFGKPSLEMPAGFLGFLHSLIIIHSWCWDDWKASGTAQFHQFHQFHCADVRFSGDHQGHCGEETQHRGLRHKSQWRSARLRLCSKIEDFRWGCFSMKHMKPWTQWL